MSDLTLRHGETRTIDIAVTDEDDSVQPITGSLFWLTVKADWLDADSTALFTLTNDGDTSVAVTDAVNGLAEAYVTPALFSAIDNEPHRLVYGLTEKDTGDRVYRLSQGTLLVTPVVKETIS